MKVQVVYYSRGGNTQRLAEAIAKGANISAESIEEARIEGPVDILFVGGAIYGGGLNSNLTQFLKDLPAGQIGKIVTFSNSLSGISIVPLVRQLLEPRGITVSGYEFRCKGQFLLFNRKRPNERDLRRAREFAVKIIDGEE